MKTLNIYISEKLKIDKDVHSKYMYDYFVFADCVTKNTKEFLQAICFITVGDKDSPDGWLIEISDLPKIINFKDIKLYKLPKEPRTVNDFLEKYKRHQVNVTPYTDEEIDKLLK
jgi:hypothetical protein